MTVQRMIELSEKKNAVVYMALEIPSDLWNGFVSKLMEQESRGIKK